MATSRQIFAGLTKDLIVKALEMLEKLHPKYLEDESRKDKPSTAQLQLRLIKQTVDSNQYAELGFAKSSFLDEAGDVKDILDEFRTVREGLFRRCHDVASKAAVGNQDAYWQDVCDKELPELIRNAADEMRRLRDEVARLC